MVLYNSVSTRPKFNFLFVSSVGLSDHYTFILSHLNFEAILHIGNLIFILAMIGLAANRNSVMLYMVGLEMLMLSCGFNYVIFSLYLNKLSGLVVALVILGIAASETAIGLGIIVACYSRNYSLNMLDFEKSGGF